ncbi:MAG: MAE_28990/MAE_18760 family HEPN-like nuclease [Flavobacteriaceae bacterium]
MSNLDKFFCALESDLAWRKKEVSNLLLLCDDSNREIIIKSAILLIYAHWEGYVKNSCKCYLEYVSQKSILITELTDNFRAISLKGEIRQMMGSQESLTLSNELSFLLSLNGQKPKQFKVGRNFKNDEKDKSIVNTRDNLNYKVFNSLLDIVGIGRRPCLDSKEVFLDEKLLNNRNKIAHGNKINTSDNEFNLEIEDVKRIKDLVFIILGSLMDDLEYYAEKEFYLQENIASSGDYNEKGNDCLNENLKNLFS